jgi:HEAT repeat protein
MEFLDGEALSSRIKRGGLAWSEAYPILEQTLRALRAAHDKGFVHRDLKPDNIWLKPSDAGVEVKLLDFGIAKLVGGDEKLTQTGSIMGTPHYMSPEQINGSANVDRRTDLYALGVIAYEMFAGVTPFVGDTLQAIITGHLFTEAPRLANVPSDRGVPAPIAEIIDRLLAKDPAARYQTASDVLADLEAVREHRAPVKAPTLASTRIVEPVKPPRSKRWLVAGAAAAAAAGGFLIWTLRGGDAAAPIQAPPVAAAPVKRVEPPKPDAPLDYDKLRKDAQTTLRASIKEAEPAVRVVGADALGKIKDAPSVPGLTELVEKDPDAEARGHAAGALGAIGASDAAKLLAKLETAAPAPLKVWYAAALARLGDAGARKRLLGYAGDKDLPVAFKAALAVADASQPGDADAIAALRAIAAHEADLNGIAPYAGAVILTKLAALHDAQARKILYSILDTKDEGARLAAAEGLAKLGDDAGKKVLQAVAANEASPNRLVASVALVPLGEYAGFDLLTAKLADKDPETRRLAARGLGDIGERKSVTALVELAVDKDWTVRVAAAAAVMAIVGLDPAVLAQSSVDWTKSALASEDWAVRKAAAGVLGDMPEKQAVPLLAQAIVDRDPKVRAAASKSAGKMKTAEAATKVAAVVLGETDPAVKEEQVRALGAIGNPVAHDVLAAISHDNNRVAVFAAGSLVAVGDASGKAKLDEAVVDAKPEMRLAAVQSASEAKNPVVVPTLVTGAADKVFDVRFTAAEGLAGFGAEKATAVPVLVAGLDSKDAAVQGRASSALLRLGERPAQAPSPAEMLDSADPKVRAAAIPIVVELPAAEAAPLVRRLVADPDVGVRRGGVDAIARLVPKAKDEAVKLYKPLVSDADAAVRSIAQAQLAKLVEPPPTPPPQPPAPTPPVDDTKVKAAAADTTAATGELAAATDAVDALGKDIATAIAQPAGDDAAIKHAEQLAADIDAAAARLDAAVARLETAAKALEAEAPPPDLAALVTSARDAATAARAARAKSDVAAKKARDYAKAETVDPQMYVGAADAAIATGNFADAKRDLDRAARMYKATGAKNAGIDYSYGQLYDKLASHEQDPQAKRRYLELAQQSYQTFARTGAGSRVQRATDRATEIADDLAELAK